MNASSTARSLQRLSRRAWQTNTPISQAPKHARTASFSTPFQQQPSIRRNRFSIHQIRHNSNETSPQYPLTNRDTSSPSTPTSTAPASTNPQEKREPTPEEIADRKAQEPSYELTFTCRKCMTRSTHRVTKQAYHFGTTLINCPGCKNRHLISDHLKIFSDKGITIEDILREKGELLRKGKLGEDGMVEFYDDAAAETVNKVEQLQQVQYEKRVARAGANKAKAAGEAHVASETGKKAT